MFIVRASQQFHWLEKRVGISFSSKAKAIAALKEGTDQIMGMVGYDHFTQNSAQAHYALDTPIAWRALAQPSFDYPFMELKLGLLIGMVLSTNTRSLELTEHIGFTPTYRIDDAVAPGVHFVIFEMRREHCRWLKE